MAQLPPSGEWLVQQHGERVVLFHRYTEEELVNVPNKADDMAKAQLTIYELKELTDEQKCFAHFWFGYFHAHSSGEMGGF